MENVLREARPVEKRAEEEEEEGRGSVGMVI